MRNKATFSPKNCVRCNCEFIPTAGRSKYCIDCKAIVDKERKQQWYIKNNPNAYKSPPSKKSTETCFVCGNPFYSSYDGINLCQTHYNLAYRTGSPYSPAGKPNTNSFCEKDGYMVGKTKSGTEYLFDKEDYSLVSKSSWCLSNGYLVANINHKSIKLHRFILNAENGSVVDHINHNPLDNRKSNLRITTHKNNSRNTSVSKSSKIKHLGISTTPSGKYRARIMVEGKEIRLGHYQSLADAIHARKEAEIKYFGEFAPSLHDDQ
jgi:hypothetical protein